MTLKVKAWENGQEKIIPLSDITGSVTRDRQIFDIAAIIGDEVTLTYAPQSLSEMVAVNGLIMTEGASYDYTISGAVITFNGGVLTQTGHVLINYSY